VKKVLFIVLAVMTGDSVRAEVAKAIPAVGGAAYAWFTLNEWVAIGTLLYLALQGAFLLRKWWLMEKNK
jgi:hypothetical protein